MSTIRMQAMLKRLQVDTLELAYSGLGAAYHKARETCRRCANAECCVLWLADEDETRPDFCPNLDLFERFTDGVR